jgi:hypothetical protein
MGVIAPSAVNSVLTPASMSSPSNTEMTRLVAQYTTSLDGDVPDDETLQTELRAILKENFPTLEETTLSTVTSAAAAFARKVATPSKQTTAG